MIRKSGYRFSDKVMLKQREEHDPEKWVPVFRQDHAQTERKSGMTIRGKAITLEPIEASA